MKNPGASETDGIHDLLRSQGTTAEARWAEGPPVFLRSKQTLRITLACSIYKRLQARAALNKHLGVLAQATVI